MSECFICGRNYKNVYNKEYKEMLCRTHDNHYNKYGEFFKYNIKSENEYVDKEDYFEIILRNRQMKEVGRCLIDKRDYDKVKMFKWKFSRGYCSSNKGTFMHVLLLGKKENMCIDHINRNRLDCRRENLRHVTFHVNGWNKGKQSNNTSGHVGVSFEKRKSKWEAHIKIHGNKKFLGYYSEIDDAVKARKEAEVRYFGEEVNRENDIYTVFK